MKKIKVLKFNKPMKKIIKLIPIILNGIHILIVILFILDILISFDIKSQFIKSFAYYGIMLMTPIVLIYNLICFKKLKKLFSAIFPLLVLIGILFLNPLVIDFQVSAWQTQRIYYQNTIHKNQRVEFQLQDIGALGYKKRTVQVIYITKYFMIVSPPCNCLVEPEWKKVDIYVNEVGLK